MQTEPVVSAGGVVVRKDSLGEWYVALEQQTDRDDANVWFLPKGHVEAGESIEATALREIAEEAGVHDVVLKQKIGVKHRIGSRCGKQKEIHYFLFETTVEELNPTATDKPHRGKWFKLFDKATDVGFDVQREVLEEVRSIYNRVSA